MKPYKKPKYKIDPDQMIIKNEEDISEEELYAERLREKNKFRRK